MRFFKKFRRRRALDRDLSDELRFHEEMSGRAKFGNRTLIQEACRDLWTFTAAESWWQDLRYGVRTLLKNPGVTVAAVVALALGIGANTAVFTVVNAAFTLDYGTENADRLVLLQPGEGLRDASPAALLLDARELQTQIKSLKTISVFTVASVNLSDSANLPEQYHGAIVSPNLFDLSGRHPAIGRAFGDSEIFSPVVVISDRLWQDRYGRDPQMIGRTIRVDEVSRTVIGVMPPGLQFPEWADLWIPLNPAIRRRPLIGARLADGATIAQARAELEAVAQHVVGNKPGAPLVEVMPLLQIYGVYASRPMFLLQMAAVGFVLLIACANVANLLLARAATRSREISIRMAIGAGRARVVRQLLIESLVLSITGGLFGWLTALGFLRWVDRMTLDQGRPPWVDMHMNAHVMIFFAAICLGTGILFGLAPALRLAKVDVISAVKDGGAAAAGGIRGRRLGNLLVIFEMALCVVLLTGAGLMIRSSLIVYDAPTGVDASNVLTAHINLPENKYRRAEDRAGFHRELKARLESLPGVESASLASALPTWGYGLSEYTLQMEGSGERIATEGLPIDPDYFRAMRVRTLHGRIFSDSEKDAMVINGIFAARYFPGEDPVGKHLLAGESWRTIVGVVPDIQQGILPGRTPLVYLPYAADPRPEMFLVARTAVPPLRLADAFRKQTQSLDPDLPLYDIRTLENRIAMNRLNVGAIGLIFTVFAAIGLVLASVGLYALSAHAVSQRTREIGVRMAMGGSSRSIVALVFSQGLRQIAIGLAAGLPLAMAVTRGLRGALVGVSAFDPATLAGVIAVLAVVGALGCAIPARRAVRVDPVAALRCE
jgi:putative ABC transport system permease protein